MEESSSGWGGALRLWCRRLGCFTSGRGEEERCRQILVSATTYLGCPPDCTSIRLNSRLSLKLALMTSTSRVAPNQDIKLSHTRSFMFVISRFCRRASFEDWISPGFLARSLPGCHIHPTLFHIVSQVSAYRLPRRTQPSCSDVLRREEQELPEFQELQFFHVRDTAAVYCQCSRRPKTDMTVLWPIPTD